jgi:hypothetical protein
MGMGDVDSWVGMGVTTPDDASHNTHSDVVESSVSLWENGRISLYTTSQQENLDIGADVNERGPRSWTLLEVASWGGKLGSRRVVDPALCGCELPGQGNA